MFERATRLKLRFETTKGCVYVEDLWDMPLTSKNGFNLDDLARGLSKKVKALGDDESFVKPPVYKGGDLLELMFEIVKHVIKVKMKERDDRESEVVRKDKKAQILKIIKDKKDDAVKNQPIEDLEKMLDNL